MSCAVPFLVSRFQDFLFCAIIHGWLLVCGSNSVIKYCCKGFLCFRTSLLTKDQQIAQCLPLTPCHSRCHQCSHCLKGSRQTDISTDTAYRITLQHPDYHLNCQPGGFPATINVESSMTWKQQYFWMQPRGTKQYFKGWTTVARQLLSGSGVWRWEEVYMDATIITKELQCHKFIMHNSVLHMNFKHLSFRFKSIWIMPLNLA